MICCAYHPAARAQILTEHMIYAFPRTESDCTVFLICQSTLNYVLLFEKQQKVNKVDHFDVRIQLANMLDCGF